MKSQGKRTDGHKLLSFLGVYFLGLNFLGVILAMLGIFYTSLLLLYTLISFAFFIYLIRKKRITLGFSRSFLAIFLLSVCLALFFSQFTTPTIFSGRDQGSYSETAIRLVRNHNLEFSSPASRELFKIYGPGKALNYPGFDYKTNGNLTTHFLFGYPVWLAIFYSFFSLNGLVVANAVSFLIFLLSFYLLANFYLGKAGSSVAFAMISTSFIFSWFFKFTLSENLALAIIFFGLYQLSIFLKNSKKIYLFSSLFSFFVLLFVKIESLAFIAAISAIFYFKFRKNKSDWKFFFNKRFFLISAVLSAIYLWNFVLDISYYKIFAKGFLHSFSGLASSSNASAGFFTGIFYTLKIFAVYGLLAYVIIAIISLLYYSKSKKYEILVPFLVLAPSFIYILQPSISSDHPWLLRRFLFSVIPVCILYTVMFLNDCLKKKYIFYLLSFLIILANITISIPYIFTSENKGLLKQTEIISRSFTENDLVFIDREATGDGFSMMTGPMSFLYNKQAVYFINPSDIEKVDRSKFSHIYFVIPDDNLELYEKSGLISSLSPVKDYQIETTRLDAKIGKKIELASQPIDLPIEKSIVILGKIYILN
jgi:hypothetical protein